MSNQKPTITISDKASKTNIKEQMDNIVRYAEGIERDIALATTNNEVVQARGGYDTLTQRLAVPHSQLPVFDYEIVGTVGSTTTVKCSLTWKGRHWRDTVTVTVDATVAHYKILCFDPDTEKFEEQHYTKVKLPLLYFSTREFSLTSYAIKNCITLFDSEGDPQEIGAFAVSDISNKSLFAWMPAGGVKKDNSFIDSIFFCNERFLGCDIDFMGIPLKYQNGLGFGSFKCVNTTIKNLKNPENLMQNQQRAQFIIEGDNNTVHLLDSTKIDFQTSTQYDNEHKNTLFIPYDTGDSYYTTMANESADRISLYSPLRRGDISSDQKEIGRHDYFTLFIRGKKYKQPKKIWEVESARATYRGAPVSRSVNITDFLTADMLYITIWVEGSSGSVATRRYAIKWGLGTLISNDVHYIIGEETNDNKTIRVDDRRSSTTTQIMTSFTVMGIEI